MSKDLCKIKKKQYIKGYQGLIFEVVDEDQVIKSIKVKKDTEGKWLKKLKKISGKYDFLFNLPLKSKRCGHYNYYLFDRLDGDLLDLVGQVSKQDRKNLLLQCLVALHIMGNKLKINHNDLYLREKIRNIMYIELEEPYKIGYDVTAKKWLIKIIDFGWANEGKPSFRSKQYALEETRSEILTFTYIYFTTIFGKDIDIKDMLISNYKNDRSFIEYIKKDFNKIYKKCEN